MTTCSYCSVCGSPLESQSHDGRLRNYCPACDEVRYRNAKPCAGVIVVDGPNVLVVKRSQPPSAGSWSVPAGFLEFDEPPKHAAVRELEEETSIQVATETLTLHDTAFVKHSEDTFVLVVLYRVARSLTDGAPTAGSDAAESMFWDPTELRDHQTEWIEPGFYEIIQAAKDASLSD